MGRKPPCPRMDPVPEVDPVDALKTLIASPNYCSRAWIYEQYDYTVMADTIRTPGMRARASCASTAPTRRWPSPPT
jgi:phosphoribosylformylglycinamidine (FGAM) synthase-like enzyme